MTGRCRSAGVCRRLAPRSARSHLEMPAAFTRRRAGRTYSAHHPDRADRGQVGAASGFARALEKSFITRSSPRCRPDVVGPGRRGWTAGFADEAVGVISNRSDSEVSGWAVGGTPQMFPRGSRSSEGLDFLLQMHFHLSSKPGRKSLVGSTDRAPDKDVLGRVAGSSALGPVSTCARRQGLYHPGLVRCPNLTCGFTRR